MIESCLVAHPAIDELLREGHFGRASEVTLRVGVGTGERAALAEPADIIMDLPPEDQGVIFRVLPRERAGMVFSYLPITHQEQLLQSLSHEMLQSLVAEMTPS